jgi:L-glyceraldehyde 3-phosphate reductase
MFNRWIEDGLLDVLEDEGIGCIVYVPLAQGILTDKYLDGIPEDSRAAKAHGALKREQVTESKVEKVRQLNKIAGERGQSMAQLAVSWILRQPAITSVLMGASRPEQIEENAAALDAPPLSEAEEERIESILSD